jgi:hypothetical protein
VTRPAWSSCPEEFFAAERERGKRYQVIFRDDDARSVKVELGEALGR